MFLLRIIALGLSLALLPYVPVFAQDTMHGESAFKQKCASCHSLEENVNKNGPSLYAVFGRTSGKATNYPYSAALKKAELTWTAETLDRYLADPAKTVPGTKMLIRMSDAATRADIIAFLKSRTSPTP